MVGARFALALRSCLFGGGTPLLGAAGQWPGEGSFLEGRAIELCGHEAGHLAFDGRASGCTTGVAILPMPEVVPAPGS